VDPFHLIRRAIKERQEAMTDYVASGAPKNYEEYRQAVGALQELERLTAELQEIEQRLIADD
jgi:hypothetical protein